MLDPWFHATTSAPSACAAGEDLDLAARCKNVKKVKLSLCLTKHHGMKTYWRSGGIAPRILDLGTRWRWVVSFTPRPLYPQGKSPCYPLDRRLGGPQKRSGHGGEEKNSQPPRTPIVKPVTQRYTDWAITALGSSLFISESVSSGVDRLYGEVMEAVKLQVLFQLLQ
jgi:hypothetical protein